MKKYLVILLALLLFQTQATLRAQGQGYVPSIVVFDTEESCREHADDAYNACLYYLSHPSTDANKAEVSQYIFSWAMRTELVVILLGRTERRWMTRYSDDYLAAYIASSIVYAYNHRDEMETFGQYQYAVAGLVEYYRNNKATSGENKVIEEYLTLKTKNEKAYDKKVKKDFQYFQKKDRIGWTQEIRPSW